MFYKLSSAIFSRYYTKLSEELTTPMEVTEAAIGRDSRKNLTPSNLKRNTSALKALTEGQYKGVKMVTDTMIPAGKPKELIKQITTSTDLSKKVNEGNEIYDAIKAHPMVKKIVNFKAPGNHKQ
jgi:hypothetical protein